MVEVSAAKRNITPPFPMYMRGYAMRTGKSIGVLDELYCRTLVLRIDGEIFIWSTWDLCRLEEPISDYARTVLAGNILFQRKISLSEPFIHTLALISALKMKGKTEIIARQFTGNW